MQRAKLQECLASLYLRLNGYFVSGFIVHSPQIDKKTNRTQIDVLAVRFPHNSEPDRGVSPSEYLQISDDRTDILICEVKGGEEKLQFNRALRDDPHAVATTLRWIGAFTKPEINKLVKPVIDILSPQVHDTSESFREHAFGRRYRLRAVLFAPDRPYPRRNQPRFIPGEELVSYLWRCFREDEPRLECATRYDYGLWGEYEGIVRCFKSVGCKPTMQEIYGALSNT